MSRVLNKIVNHGDFSIIEVVKKDKSWFVVVDTDDLDKIGTINVFKGKYAYKSGKPITNIIMDFTTNAFTVIDHKDGDTLNNRKSNLRICSQSENCRNRHSFSRNNTEVVGIQLRSKGNYEYYRVSWIDTQHNRHTKSFNTRKISREGAFEEAKKFLEEQKSKNSYYIQ